MLPNQQELLIENMVSNCAIIHVFNKQRNINSTGKPASMCIASSRADTSCWTPDSFHAHVNYGSLIRGALLHDYFLYDRHDKSNGHRRHGFFIWKAGLFASQINVVL